MKMHLTPELERIIRKKVETGQYKDEGDVIRESLRFMAAHEKLIHQINFAENNHASAHSHAYTQPHAAPNSTTTKIQQQSAPKVFFSEDENRSESDYVFNYLRENIYRGELKPGEQLLPAKRISELMEVTQRAVRTALTQLVKAGFLDNTKNKYYVTSVKEQNPPQLFSSIMTPQKSSLDELLEVRLGLETYGVGLAVERADKRDIKFMQEAVNELTLGRPDKQKAQEADIKFHMGIAFSTHNLVHIDLIRRFYDYMFHSISTLHELLYEEPHNLEIIDQHHFKILDAISGRDKKSAERYMLQHILFLKSFIKDMHFEGR